MASLPFVWSLVFLLVVVFCRAQGTYWLGRGLATGAVKTRWGARLDSQSFQRGTQAIAKWGWPIIPVSFLTVGFQTAVNAAAGLIRMDWRRYTLAMLPGCIAWALIWSTIGWAAFEGALALAARSPWALLAVVAAVGCGVGILVWRRRVGRPTSPAQARPEA